MSAIPEVSHFNPYVEPTIALVLRLLEEAAEDQNKLDKILKQMSDQVFAELTAEIQRLVDDGKIDFDKKIDLYNNPALLTVLKQIEREQLQKFTEYCWIGSQVVSESMARSYSTALNETYLMFNYQKGLDAMNLSSGPKSYNAYIQTTDTYVYDKIVNVPWCQDGAIYSDRLWGHISQFKQKLSYVLEEGVSKGKGLEWMNWAWRELTGSQAYNTARLLKTETMAMWSIATKSAYLEMGIEYVAIIGDALCGNICTEFVDSDPVPLAEAEIGGLLPPYHPNCACSFVAYNENISPELGEEY